MVRESWRLPVVDFHRGLEPEQTRHHSCYDIVFLALLHFLFKQIHVQFKFFWSLHTPAMFFARTYDYSTLEVAIFTMLATSNADPVRVIVRLEV